MSRRPFLRDGADFPVKCWFLLLVCVVLVAPASAQTATDLLKQAGVQGGLIVHLGCGDGSLTAELRAGEGYVVHGLDTDPSHVSAARQRLQQRGMYGPASVDAWDGRHLPYADNFANLIIADDVAQADPAELMRVLAPQGVLLTRKGGQWQRSVKPRPDKMDEWTHYFHGPDGNPVADDTAVGPPEHLQWIGSPRWARHHDHMASMTSLVSAQGRLFYILDEGPRESIQLPSSWRLIARDAFNGTILWKREIEQWNTRQYPLKSGPAHLLRRLVAIGDRVFVTLGIDSPVSVLDAATGETITTYDGSQFTREIVTSAGVVFLLADTSPSRLPDWRRVSTYVWDNTRRANPDWGWHGNSRQILAYSVDTGECLWKTSSPVAPCSLAVDATRVVFHDGKKLVSLDRRNGETLWESEATPTELPVQTNTGPRVVLYGDVVLLAANNGKISGWSAQDGRNLWEQKHRPSGHMSLKDLLVVDGLVWTGDIAGSQGSGVFTGYDPLTGEVRREFPPDVNVHWFHHRCYPAKAAGQYLLTARNGTEFIDLETEHWKPHHWVRGGCIYGVMPCNGMMYASMDACGCQLEAKLSGFKALVAGPLPGSEQAASVPRLQKGPAFGDADGPHAGDADWPTYRHDAARSGSSAETVSSTLGLAWQTKLGGRLSAPTIAAGQLFVASVDTHTVHALNAKTGESSWSFTAGARVDSPPTYYQGLVLFGSADGYVYAVRARDGVLAWRFRGAPLDRRMMAWEQLESGWPVHGSVLVHEGVLYCTAGRSMFLDGGIRFLRLEPTTGQLLGEVVMNDRDPDTGEEMHLAHLKKTNGNNMPVALSDILSCDGRYIWMRSQKMDFEGNRMEIGLQDVNEQPAEDCHLFCQVGFLDDSYFFRTYWTYGRRVTGGYGGWLKAGRLVPSGRILCFDDSRVYGFGRKPEFMTNSSVLQYEIYSADKAVSREAIDRIRQAEAQINSRSARRNANSSDWLLRRFFDREDLSAANYEWTVEQPSVLARAMALGQDTVFVCGPPNFVDERQIYRQPDAPETLERIQQQQEAFEGSRGGVLWAIAKEGGNILARYELETVPVFDGMAAANGCLYVSTLDGRVLCLSADGQTPLKSLEDLPARIEWDQPEDPGHLLPAEEPREDDFDHVAPCKVVASDLGYRLKPPNKARVQVALKKLPQPVRGVVTLKTRMQIPTDTSAMLNGFLAFGDGTVDGKLVKCGVRLRLKRAMVLQGLMEDAKSENATVDAAQGQILELVATVDLANQHVTFTTRGVTVEAPLDRPIKAITHVGYVADNAIVDFAPVEVEVE